MNARITSSSPLAAEKVLMPRRLVRPLIAGLAAGLLLGALGDYLVVWPESAKAANRRTQLAALARENEDLESLIGTPEAYDAFKRSCDAEQQQFDQALSIVPSEAELAAALEDLRSVMTRAKVDLVSFTPAPLPPPGPAAAKPSPKPGQPVPPPPPIQIQARTIDVTARADFRSYQALLAALAGNQRLLTTEGFSMQSIPAERGFTLRSRMTIRCYFKTFPPAPAPAQAPSTRQG